MNDLVPNSIGESADDKGVNRPLHVIFGPGRWALQ
jgi:hypothetical protein